VFTVILSGPVLFAVMETPLLWEEDVDVGKPASKRKVSHIIKPKALQLKLGTGKYGNQFLSPQTK